MPRVPAATTRQNGNGDPYEVIGAGSDVGRKLMIVRKKNEPARLVYLSANRGRLEYATAGQIGGHPAARDAIAVAAVEARFFSGENRRDRKLHPPQGEPRQLFFMGFLAAALLFIFAA